MRKRLRGARGLPVFKNNQKPTAADTAITQLVRSEINNYFRNEIKRELRNILKELDIPTSSLSYATKLVTRLPTPSKPPTGNQLLSNLVALFLKQ